jgi:hypothetical protein
MLGPDGIFANQDTSKEADELTSVPREFGLAYRFILNILFKIQNDEDFLGKNIKLTVSGAEVSYRDPMDLLTKKVITLDLNSNRFRGLKQVPISNTKELMDFAKIIEDASSNTSNHLIELLMYSKTGNLVHVNCFKFFDLCGSEKSHNESNYEVLCTKASLSVLANVAKRVAALPKPLSSGDEIPDFTGYKESAISRVFSSSFNGGAFNILICCIN